MNGSPIGALLFPVLLVAAFYLLAVRPQRNRMRQLQRAQAELAPGREVMTTAGLYATVVDVAEDSVRLEIAPGVTARFARAAIARTVDPPALPGSDEAVTGPAPGDQAG